MVINIKRCPSCGKDVTEEPVLTLTPWKGRPTFLLSITLPSCGHSFVTGDMQCLDISGLSERERNFYYGKEDGKGNKV